VQEACIRVQEEFVWVCFGTNPIHIGLGPK